MNAETLTRLKELVPHGKVSEVARLAGMSRGHVAQYVRGARAFTISAAAKLSAALDGQISVEELVGELPDGVRFWRDELPAAGDELDLYIAEAKTNAA